MKTNTLNFVDFFYTSLVSVLILVIVGASGTARAQNTQSVLNGLFTPTSADRFFEEGRRDMERQIEILVHPELYSREDILQINITDIKKIEETEETKPIDNFSEDIPQDKFD